MNIINFTPISAFVGGSLIGFAAFLFFAFNGRMAGVSSIASGSIIFWVYLLLGILLPKKED